MAENQTALTPDQANWLKAYAKLRGDFIADGLPSNHSYPTGLAESAGVIGASVIYLPDPNSPNDEIALVLDPALASAVIRNSEQFNSHTKPYGGLPVIMNPDLMGFAWDMGLDGYLLNSDGEKHREQRDAIEDPLLRSALELYQESITNLAEEVVAEIGAQKETFEVGQIIRKVPFGTMCMLLDLNPDSEEAKELLDLVPDITNFDGNPLALMRSRDIISKFIGSKIENPDSISEEATVLSAILSARNKEGSSITDDDVKSLFVQIFLAGMESTEALLTKAFIEHITGTATSGATVPRIGRTAISNVELTDTRGSAWSFNEGQRVFVDLRAVDHLAKDSNSTLNFGRGDHHCPGRNLALIQKRAFIDALNKYNLDWRGWSIYKKEPGMSGLSTNYSKVMVSPAT